MVSSAKLKKAQYAIESITPYQSRLNKILSNFLATETDFQSAFAEVRPVSRVAVIAFSSNSSLCGAYNSNVAKQLNVVVKEQLNSGAEVVVYPIGKKITEQSEKLGVPVVKSNNDMADHPSFDAISEVTNELMNKFLAKEFDKVIVVYHHLKNTAVQKLQTEVFLPIALDKNSGHSPRKAMPCFSATPARGSVWWMRRNNPTRPGEGGGRFSATPHSMPCRP